MGIDNVADITPRLQYIASAAQTAFDYNFSIFTSADLVVVVDGVTKALDTDYTVDRAEEEDTDTETHGGTVTFLTPMTGGEIVTIYRDIVIERDTDIQQNGPWSSTAYNDEQDKTYLIMQQIQANVDRSLRIPIIAEVASDDIVLEPANFAGMYLTFDSDGKPTPAALSSSTMTQSTIGQLFYPRTAAEISAGVTPTYYYYEPGDVRRYGAAGDGTTDDSTALTNACSANTSIYFPPGSYKVASAATVSIADSTLYSDGFAEIITNGTDGLTVSADGVKLSGIAFRSLKTSSTIPDTFVRAYDVGGLQLIGCTIGRGCIVNRSTGSGTVTHALVDGCYLTGDFTGASASDWPNIFEFRGVTDVVFTNNTCTATNFYRMLKVTAATGDSAPYDTGRSRRVVITGNVVNSSCAAAQEIIDTFASTEELIISNNQFSLSGASVPTVISCKPGDSSSNQSAFQNNISICNNVFRLGDGVRTPIYAGGAWGLAWFSQLQKCVISGNIIQTDSTHGATQIDVKGMNNAVVSGNIIERPVVQYGRAINAGNNQCITICNNSISAGDIELVGNASTPGAESYGNQPESILISGNIVDDIDTYGCVSFFNITACEEITIANNHLRNQTDTATVVGAVYFNTVSGVEYLNIHDNRARMANSSKNKVGGSVTVTARIEHNNGWNVGLRVTDGVTAPSTESGYANIYVDTADGDLKVKFGDGTVKTIVVDT